jgi:tetratricopeptide (TPR) repeat protein
MRARYLAGLLASVVMAAWPGVSGVRADTAVLTPELAKAQRLVQIGDLDGAIAILNAQFKINPNDARTYHVHAMVLKAKKDFDGAIADETKAIGLDPTVPDFWYYRGVYVRYNPATWFPGDKQKALKDFQQALELDSNYGPARREIAKYMYYVERNLTNANVAALAATRVDPKDGESWFLIGQYEYWSGHNKEAIAAWTKAIFGGRSDAEVFENRGYLEGRENQRKQAIADYQMALSLEPGRRPAVESLARLQAGKGGIQPVNLAHLQSDEPVDGGEDPWAMRMRSNWDKFLEEDGIASGARHDTVYNQADRCNMYNRVWTALHNANGYLSSLIADSRSEAEKTLMRERLAKSLQGEAIAQGKLKSECGG